MRILCLCRYLGGHLMCFERNDLTLGEINDFFQCGILVMQNLQIISCNDRAIEIFGYEKEEFIGKTPFDLSPEEQADGTASREKWEKIVHNAEHWNNFHWLHIQKNGHLISTNCKMITKD